MHPARRVESRRYTRHCPQCIGHQCGAPGPGLDQPHGVGRATLLPDHGRPCAEQFTEHLGDFRRCGEVGEGVVGGVVGAVCARHETVQAF